MFLERALLKNVYIFLEFWVAFFFGQDNNIDSLGGKELETALDFNKLKFNESPS